MGGMARRRTSIVSETVLGLINKCRISEVTKTSWRERQNKRERLCKVRIPGIAKRFEPRRKEDRMEPRVQVRLHFLGSLPTSLPHLCVNDIAARK